MPSYDFSPAIKAGIAKFNNMNRDDQTRAASLDENIENIQLFSNPSPDLMAYFIDKYTEISGTDLFGTYKFLYFHYGNGTVINNHKYQSLVRKWYEEGDDSIKVFLKIKCGGLL